MQNKSSEEADVVVLSEKECELFETEALALDERTGKYKYSAGVYGVMLLHTGMRCGEMLALRWKDIDFENGLLKIEKSQSMAKNRDRKEGDNTSENDFICVTKTGKVNTATNLGHRMAVIFKMQDCRNIQVHYIFSEEPLLLRCMKMVQGLKI